MVEADRLAAVQAAGVRAAVVVDIGTASPPDVPFSAEAVFLTSRVPPAAGAIDSLVFAIRTLSTAVRAAHAETVIVLDARLARHLTAPRVRAYVNALAIGPESAPDGWDDVPRWRRQDAARAASLEELLDWSRAARGEPLLTPAVDPPIVEALAHLQSVLTSGLTPLRGLRVTCQPACEVEVYLQPDTQDAIVVARAGSAIDRIDTASGNVHVEASAGRLTVARVRGWRAAEAPGFTESTDVVGARALTVEEIVARHQAQRRRQDVLVLRTIAHGTATVLFEVPGSVAPVTIASETVTFTAPGVKDVVHRGIRVNGTAIAGGSAESPPALPLLEPERVSTPPLVIALDEAYEYRLEREEAIDDGRAYVVSFSPLTRPRAGAEKSLVRGRAWIDASSFALRRVEAVQLDLHGPIVSSEQHEIFSPFDTPAGRVWLTTHLAVFQLYEGAGLRTPIHRTARTPRYEIEPADFEVRLAAAHASNDVMLRETPSGLRYLLRSKPAAGEARTVAPRAGERVRTIVFGAIVDPNITTPLPFGGLSYADLNLFGSGTQLNVFFGGAYGQLAWSAPSLGGTRWQASVRAFAIAARYNDRAFRGGVEQYDENITQRPASVSAAVAHPIGGRLRWRGGYDFEYTAFDRTDVTAPAFVVPADAIVHALRTGIDADAGPWTARVWWSPAHRQGWRPWGFPPAKAGPGAGPVDPPLSTFQRFGASVSRTLALSPSIAGRAEVEWVSGRGLDRFSRYTFDSFERRLHGYPTASIRYDRGAVARSIVAWSRRGWRLDGFADLAVVRDPTISRRSEAYPGVGAAVELPGPLRTLWSVDWGYGFRARRTDGGTGTHALRITAYRVF